MKKEKKKIVSYLGTYVHTNIRMFFKVRFLLCTVLKLTL